MSRAHRINVDVDEELWRALKGKVGLEGTTITKVVLERLSSYLSSENPTSVPVPLPTKEPGPLGIPPGSISGTPTAEYERQLTIIMSKLDEVLINLRQVTDNDAAFRLEWEKRSHEFLRLATTAILNKHTGERLEKSRSKKRDSESPGDRGQNRAPGPTRRAG